MASHAFGAFINLDQTSPITEPPAALPKTPQASSFAPPDLELNQSSTGGRDNGLSVPANPDSAPAPISRNELGKTLPSAHQIDDATDAVQTLSSPPINRYRLLSACCMCFANGLNDSAPGALIPYLEKHYSIGYAVVSLIFVTNAIGFISAAPLTYALQLRLGRAKMLVLTQLIMMVAYVMLVCQPPFPVVVLSFFFTGLGMAFNLALNNVFCANFANGTTTLGLFHGSYGIGGTIGPLIATALVSHGHSWSSYYYIPLSLTALNAILAYLTFRTFELDNPSSLNLNPTSSRLHRGRALSRGKVLVEALRNKTTIFGAMFIFAYQGAEVSISGWVVSFLISYRHSSPSRVGYVTAGFWAGITIGRFLLSHPSHKVGEKIAVSCLVIGAAAFQILVWQVPNVIGEAVAVSIVGLLLGPVYPCAMAVFTRLIDRRLQMSSLAAVSALGSSGGAVAPFFTGLLAQSSGTWVLHPVCIGLFGGMLACWGLLPRGTKRRE